MVESFSVSSFYLRYKWHVLLTGIPVVVLLRGRSWQEYRDGVVVLEEFLSEAICVVFGDLCARPPVPSKLMAVSCQSL